jgi:hypothetical protein
METEDYLIDKIPEKYIRYVDRDERILYLNDKETEDSIWDIKIKYWAINLSINHNYTLKYI